MSEFKLSDCVINSYIEAVPGAAPFYSIIHIPTGIRRDGDNRTKLIESIKTELENKEHLTK